jgi:glycosyltransferase involved in cell wall biosynthesis
VKSVDLVIPCYNEERVLADSVGKLKAWCAEHIPQYAWRVVVANNASTDGTLQVAQGLAAADPEHVAVVHLDQKGRGRALTKAWGESTADGMCYMDVDLSTDLAMITPLLQAIMEDGYDISYGSRVAKGADIKRSLKREINSRGYILLFKVLFQTKFSDAQCGFKAMTRQAADELLPLVRDVEWFWDTELLVIAEKGGWKLKEVPVKWVEDPDTRTRFPQDVIKMSTQAFKLRFRKLPRRSEIAQQTTQSG